MTSGISDDSIESSSLDVEATEEPASAEPLDQILHKSSWSLFYALRTRMAVGNDR